MLNILVIGAAPRSLINFRGDLLKALVVAGHKVTAMAGDAPPEIVEQLTEMGVTFRPFPVQRNAMNPLGDLKTLLALRKAYRELKPNIVLAYTIKPVIWGGLALRGNRHARFYAMIEGLGFAFQGGSIRRNMLGRIVAFMYKVALSSARKVIFLNPDNRQTFLDQKIIYESKAAMIDGIGVNFDIYQHTPLPISAHHNIVFLTIGRLLGEKGFREYAQASRIVKERYPEAVFCLVGPSDPSPDGIALEEVQGWHEAGWIEYLGESKDVRQHLAGCHVYVLPSYHEGLPRTVLEAMAMGRPILTTDVPGCRETVIPGENGWLVPKADAKALAERMTWFIEHRDEWQRMAVDRRFVALGSQPSVSKEKLLKSLYDSMSMSL